MAYPQAVLLEFVSVDVLVRERQFGAEKYDQPAYLEPDKKQRQGCEAAVNSIIFRQAYDETEEGPLGKL